MREMPLHIPHGQYHGCWWPGSLCLQVISSHGIDYAGWRGNVFCDEELQLCAGLILGLRPANERRRYFVTASHWLGTSLESALCVLQCWKIIKKMQLYFPVSWPHFSPNGWSVLCVLNLLMPWCCVTWGHLRTPVASCPPSWLSLSPWRLIAPQSSASSGLSHQRWPKPCHLEIWSQFGIIFVRYMSILSFEFV